MNSLPRGSSHSGHYYHNRPRSASEDAYLTMTPEASPVTPSKPASGVTQFLRHFTPRRESVSPGRYFRSLKKNRNPPDFASPVSVVGSLPESSALWQIKSAEVTRLGISPTHYDVPKNCVGVPLPSSLSLSLERDAEFFTENAPKLPNLLTSLATTWQESETAKSSSSPQKSIASGSSSDCSSAFTMSAATDRHFRSNSAAFSETKRKAKEIVQRARDKDNASGSKPLSLMRGVAPIPTDSPLSTVKICLLLLEPESKLFELIQLVYPRKNTKVGDLLKMIPKNATEAALASQSYVGITRPKRRSEPITDLKLLASNSVTVSQETANIAQGEIIIAIPAHSSSSQIVSLAKQILASSHIQKLIVKSNSRRSSGKPHRKKVRRGSKSSIGSAGTKSTSLASTTPGLDATPAGGETTSVTELVDKDTVCDSADSNNKSLKDYYEGEMKRAVENANIANQQAGRSPCPSPTPFLSENEVVGEGCCKEVTVNFPQDMLDAYLSKEAVQKMCGRKHNLDRTVSMADDLSCDGSLTSSFHSWSLSLDESAASLGNCATLDQHATGPSPLTRKKQLAKCMATLKRCAAFLFFLSVARYLLDSNGAAAAVAARGNIGLQPMGWIGLFQFMGAFITLCKAQSFVKKLSLPSRRSKCPVMLVISQIYESRTAGPSSASNGIIFA